MRSETVWAARTALGKLNDAILALACAGIEVPPAMIALRDELTAQQVIVKTFCVLCREILSTSVRASGDEDAPRMTVCAKCGDEFTDYLGTVDT